MPNMLMAMTSNKTEDEDDFTKGTDEGKRRLFGKGTGAGSARPLEEEERTEAAESNRSGKNLQIVPLYDDILQPREERSSFT